MLLALGVGGNHVVRSVHPNNGSVIDGGESYGGVFDGVFVGGESDCGVFDGVFNGVFDGVFDGMFDGVFDGVFDGSESDGGMFDSNVFIQEVNVGG